MTITVCNSAYVQTETLNFTFTRQAVILYFDAERQILNYTIIFCQSCQSIH